MFTYNYYNAAWGLIQGLEAVDGDISGGQAELQAALADVELDAAYGQIKLDDNRQAIQDNYVVQIVKDGNGDGVADVKTIRKIPAVDQTFGGMFSTDTPSPDRENPACEKRDSPPPWVGNFEEVNFGGVGQPQRSADDGTLSVRTGRSHERRADPPLAGGRPALRRPPGRPRRRSRRRARRAPRDPRPERRREDDAVQRHRRRVPADVGDDRAVRTGRHASSRAHAASASASRAPTRSRGSSSASRSRTTSTSRCSASSGGHLRLVRRPGRDGELRERARELAERGRAREPARRRSCRDLSHGEQRQLEVGMALAGEPRLMMLDEPAAGPLARASA